MDTSYRKCMLCNNTGLQYVAKVRDSDHYSVYICPACGHVQLNPIPSEEEDSIFYQTNQMARITVSKNLLDDEQLRLKNKVWIDKQVALIKRIIPKEKSIFEIGSGYGWFVDEIRKAGYTADGLELSTEKCISAKKNLNIALYNMSFPPPIDAGFENLFHAYDVVCIFHVLEHVADPISFLAQTKQLLKEHGQVFVEVPNYDDYMKNICIPYHDFQYLRAHLSYFTPKSLAKVFQEAGFSDVQLLAIRNMVFLTP